MSTQSNNIKYDSITSAPNIGYVPINNGEAPVATYVSPTAFLPNYDKPKYGNQTYFGWKSDLQQNAMKSFKSSTNKQLGVLNQLFTNNDNTNTLHDNFGLNVLNATPENIWFAKNVAFIFGIGSIYDEEDDRIMNALMSYFDNNHESGFLLNHHRVEGYVDSKLIQEIEKKLKISNGNYHVFMCPIVYATSKTELAKAPEVQFSISGIVNKFMKWQTITDYMREMIAKYGLITNFDRPHDPSSWEIGQEGLSTRRGLHNDVECKFNIDIVPEQHDTPIQKDLEFKRDLEKDYNTRIRETKMNRLGEYNDKTKGRSKRMKLYEQMNGGILDNVLTSNTKFDGNLGVQLRLNEKYPPENKKYVEYQLYDDNDTYINGQNLMTQTNVNPKNDMQHFALTAVRGSKMRNPSLGGHIPNLPNKNKHDDLMVGHMSPHAIRTATGARQRGIHAGAVRDSATKY